MYRYQDHRQWVFTDEGQRALLKLRDWTKDALRRTGAFTLASAIDAAGSGDSWQRMALVDRLVKVVCCAAIWPLSIAIVYAGWGEP